MSIWMKSFGEQLASAAWTRDLSSLKDLLKHVPLYTNLCSSFSVVMELTLMPQTRGVRLLCTAGIYSAVLVDNTPLSCRQGFSDIALELLSVPGVNVNAQVEEHGGSPLHAAGFCGSGMYWQQSLLTLLGEVTALLLVAGADVNLRNNLGITSFGDLRGR